MNFICRYETENKLATEEESKKELDEDFNKLSEEMKNVQKERDEKTKDFKEKSKKWEKLQQQKDALTIEFDEIRKKDEALHAESVATNKRRKDNMNTVKNVSLIPSFRFFLSEIKILLTANKNF